jgi:hypothetical protein
MISWDAVGAIAELVGATAVVVTLIYLSFQLKQNTKSVNSNNSNTLMQGFNQVNTAVFSNPAVAQILYSGLDAPEQLSSVEQHQFAHVMASVMNIYRNLYHQYLDGTFPERSWVPWAREAKQLLESPGGAYFLSRSRTYEDLAAYLRTVAESQVRPLSWSGDPSQAGTASDPS